MPEMNITARGSDWWLHQDNRTFVHYLPDPGHLVVYNQGKDEVLIFVDDRQPEEMTVGGPFRTAYGRRFRFKLKDDDHEAQGVFFEVAGRLGLK